MNSLLNYLESIYKRLPSLVQLDINSCEIINSNEFKDFINDDKKCIELISSVLEFPIETIFINRHRASHIIVTWILGVGFSNFVKGSTVLTGLSNLYETRLWLQTAMVHDYGYFCREIKSCLPLETLTKDYDLLTDVYSVQALKCLNGLSLNSEFKCFFSYSYQEIKNYYAYIQSVHKNVMKDFEDVSDHGIVGGCKAFSKYCKHIISLKNKIDYNSSDVITKIQKISCLIAASHNIFKSNGDSDKAYIEAGLEDLTSTSAIRVTRKNFFLALLSLVDTVECTKRFSKKDNPHEYLLQSTILSYVDINVENKVIQIDFSRLDNFIAKERRSDQMRQKLKKHIEAIAGLDSWTDFYATRNNANKEMVEVALK